MKEDINKKIINNFYNNLTFLKKYDINLYNRVLVLNQLINENRYETRYELEYIKDDENFDIFHKKTNSYIYNKKPSLFIKDAISTTNKDKINTIDLLNINVFNQRSPLIKDKNLPFHTKLRVNLINDMFEYIKILKAPINYKNKRFRYIDKFIFIGTLLGTHIKEIDDKLKAKLYFIYENNLEIFRLSLFTVDYSLLSKNSKIIFSIMDDKIDIQNKLTNYFSYNKESNYMIKYYSSNYNIGDFFDRVLSVSAIENPFNYDYQRVLNDLIKNSMKKISSSKILNTQNNSNNILKDKKILFLAAGPSLQRNIKWIKDNKDKFIIVAIAATLKTILKYNIIPNIITSADSQELVIEQFPKEYKNIFYTIPFLTSISTNKKVLKLFNKKNIFFYEIGTHFKNNSQELFAYSIGEITLQLISILGGNEIYMLGSDMALDQETGSTHISNHKFNKSYTLNKISNSSNSFIKNKDFDLYESTITVKGNFQEKVITTSKMSKSIQMYNTAINKILSQDNSKKIYNLNNGAYFDGAIPTKIENIDIKRFDNIKLSNNLILEVLNKSSQIGFSNNEINNLKDSIIIIDKLIKKVNNLKKIKLNNYSDFINNIKQISEFIFTDMKKLYRLQINRVFENYYLITIPYLTYHFNDEFMYNEDKKIKEIKKIWINQILYLAKRYKKILNKNL